MNRRQRTAVAAVALLGVLGLSGCEWHVGDGPTGPRDTVRHELEPVTAVDIRTTGTMRVSVGDEPSLTITAAEDVLERLTAVVHGDTLEIDLPGAWINAGRIEYELVVPALSSVTISGSADVTGEIAPAGGAAAVRISGSGEADLSGVTADTVTVEVDGSGNVDLTDLAAADVDVAIGGSGDVALAGTADTLTVRIPGSGDFHGADLATRDAVLDIDGSGTALVDVARTLDARVDGSGDIRYHGDPDVTSDVSGSGDIGPA